MSPRNTLDPRVIQCITERGFDEFSEIQERAIPRVLAGEHLLLIAPTGTGKTESAMIPVFNQMLTSQQGTGFTTLYITPLRSLNRDILVRMEWWSSHLGMTVGVRHGDTSQGERRKQTLSPPDLLVTTPETLQALFMGKRLREHLKSVRFVIIDEIHDLRGRDTVRCRDEQGYGIGSIRDIFRRNGKNCNGRYQYKKNNEPDTPGKVTIHRSCHLLSGH